MRLARESLALLVSACVDGAASAPWPGPSAIETFATRAQPVLAERCASPSCHGTASRPLSIYAVHRHRANPDDTFLDAELTAAELRHNVEQASAFLLDVGSADESLLLTKPLSPSAGGGEHVGGVVFADRAEYDYARLRDWAEAALAERRLP